jgi:hypothetical protein
MPLRLLQGLQNGVRAPAADHLGDAFLIGFAGDDAIGAGAALTIGAATVAPGALRKRAADLVAGLFELRGARLLQMDVPGPGRTAEAEGAHQDEQGGQISHGTLHCLSVAPEGAI